MAIVQIIKKHIFTPAFYFFIFEMICFAYLYYSKDDANFMNKLILVSSGFLIVSVLFNFYYKSRYAGSISSDKLICNLDKCFYKGLISDENFYDCVFGK